MKTTPRKALPLLAGFIIASSLILVACSNGTTENETPPKMYVYAAGYDFMTGIPRFWEMTESGIRKVELPGEGGWAFAITADKSAIYTAGWYNDGENDMPCYWRTSSAGSSVVPLLGGDGDAYSIAVDNGVIYTAGWQDNGEEDVACYWRNTSRVELSEDEGEVLASQQAVGPSTAPAGTMTPERNYLVIGPAVPPGPLLCRLPKREARHAQSL